MSFGEIKRAIATMVTDEQDATGQTQYTSGFDLLPGFEWAGPPEHPRLVASIWGEPKSGKTSFALGFPQPIIVMNLDFGLDELFKARPDLIGKCMRKNLHMNELTDPATWGSLLDEFHDSYIKALQYADVRGGTVAVDTATQLWQIVQAVKIEHVRADKLAKAEARSYRNDAARQEGIDRATKSSQLDWQLANSFMGGLIRRSLHFPRVSAVFVNRAKTAYDDGGRAMAGVYEYQGYGEMPAITQVHLQFMKKGGTHFARINSCRYDTSLEGFEIENPDYEKIRGLVLGV